MSALWSFRPLSAFTEFASSWDLLNASAGALPFLDSRFLGPLVQQFARGDEWLAIAMDGGLPVAGALLQRDGFGRITTFQPSQLPLGPWLVAGGHDPVVMARSLLAAAPGLVLGLGLTELDPYLLPRPDIGPTLETLDYVPTAWVDVDGSFDAYWEARGKNLRTNMRKQRAKLDADGVALNFTTVTRADDVAAAIAEYGRLETAGWKAGMGTAVHPDNAQGRFYTEALQNFCAAGRSRIWQLRFGERVVAMDICVEAADTLVVLKTSFDPEFRNLSPAFLLRQEAFRQVFDEGRIRRIEFYGRLMEWHTRWTDKSRMLYHANVYRWAWVPQAKQQLRRLARPAAVTAVTITATSDPSSAIPEKTA